jgi:hypothetical protein
MRPIGDPLDVTVLDRIEVKVIDVPPQIVFVSKGVFSESPLPNSAFALVSLAIRPPFSRRQRPQKIRLYSPPAIRVIRIAEWQAPDCMQMIGQDDESNNGKRCALLFGIDGVSKRFDVTHQ